jgi:hypothetical protein
MLDGTLSGGLLPSTQVLISMITVSPIWIGKGATACQLDIHWRKETTHIPFSIMCTRSFAVEAGPVLSIAAGQYTLTGDKIPAVHHEAFLDLAHINMPERKTVTFITTPCARPGIYKLAPGYPIVVRKSGLTEHDDSQNASHNYRSE